MDNELKPLPCDTVRLIGSTQVITSVYSVVKELVENSLDSDATAIEVKLENYGLDKVEVRDNGHGIRQANMPYVAKRYHTSKISSFNDLESLSTYGFRGEALGSLCAVSSLAITSKTKDESVSVTFTFDHHGAIVSKQPSHLGQGTTITASHLFKNLPVRRQFYNTVKKKKEELKRIEDLLMAFGCIKPGVRLVLKNGKDTVWQKNGLLDTRTALLGILGRNVVSQMEYKSVTCESPKVAVECYLPRPKCDVSITSRSTNDRCFIAVNNRPVHAKEIEKIIRQFYCASTSAEGRYPICYTAINISTANLDVNVDPNKTRVMLHEQKFILSQMHNLLEELYGPLKDKRESESHNDNSSDSSQTVDVSSDLNDSDLSQDGRDPGITRKTEMTSGQTYTSHKVKFIDLRSEAGKKENHSDSGIKISFHEHKVSDNAENVDKELEAARLKVIETETDKPKTEEVKDSSVIASVAIQSFKEPSNNDSDTVKDADSKLGDPALSTQANQGSFNIIDDDLDDLLQSHDSTSRKDSMETDLELDMDFLKACEFLEGTDLEKENKKCAVTCTSDKETNNKDTCYPADQRINENISTPKEKSSDQSTEVTAQPSGALQWSIGKGAVGLNGSILQPVTLLAPNSSVTSNKRSSSETESDLSMFTPPLKRKSLNVQADQPRLYDIMGKSPKEKYSVGFTAFSREERPRVLEENPDLLYDDITKLVSQNWDKLSDDDKKQYEDTGKVHIEHLKKTVLEKQHVKTKANKKIEQPSTIKEKLLSSTTKTILPIQTVKVKFCLQRLRETYQNAVKQSQPLPQSELSLIGPLKFFNGWVCCHGNKVKIINPHRVEETILFRELMDNHVISSTKLECPITLDARILGQSLMQSLVQLIPTDSCQTYVYIDDKRITSNGFQIRCHVDENNSPVLELDGVSKSIPTFGVQDLKEVVQLIQDTKASTLHQCRPLKIIYYLQGEAVRMVRQRPMMRSRDDVQDILDQMANRLPLDCVQCLHEKPFLHTLYDMDDIPVSQTTQT